MVHMFHAEKTVCRSCLTSPDKRDKESEQVSMENAHLIACEAVNIDNVVKQLHYWQIQFVMAAVTGGKPSLGCLHRQPTMKSWLLGTVIQNLQGRNAIQKHEVTYYAEV